MTDFDSSSGLLLDSQPPLAHAEYLLSARRGWLGPIPSTDRVTFTARHEAGHVVAAHVCGLPIDFATVKAGPGYAGRVMLTPDNIDCRQLHEFSSDITLHELTKPPRTILEGQPLSAGTCVLLYARMIMALAGKEADRFFKRPETMYPRADMETAAYYSLCIAGTHEAALALIDRARLDAKRILVANKHPVETVAAALIEHKTLDAGQIAAILSGRPIRRKQWTAAGAELFLAMTGGLKPLLVV